MPLPCPHIRPSPNISLNVILDWTNTLKDLANTFHVLALPPCSYLGRNLIGRDLGLGQCVDELLIVQDVALFVM